MKFIALTPIKHDGKRVEEGASIELNHQQAARLLASGSVVPFDGAKAKAEAKAHADAEAKAKSAADAEAKAHADAEADAAAETAATTAAIPPADAS